MVLCVTLHQRFRDHRGRASKSTSSLRALIVKGSAGCGPPAASPASRGLKLSTAAVSCPVPVGFGLPLLARASADMAPIVCRVQYLDDSDPFVCTNFPEPRRPPSVSLEEDVPLSEQVAGIHKLLEAPLKVGQSDRVPGPRGPPRVQNLEQVRVRTEKRLSRDTPRHLIECDPDCVLRVRLGPNTCSWSEPPATFVLQLLGFRLKI